MKNKPYVTLPSAMGVELIPISSIILIITDGALSTFTLDGDINKKVNLPLSKIENILKDAPFVKCNQSCLVNIHKISEIIKYSDGVVLFNNEQVKISRRNKKQFREKMIEYCYRLTNGV